MASISDGDSSDIESDDSGASGSGEATDSGTVDSGALATGGTDDAATDSGSSTDACITSECSIMCGLSGTYALKLAIEVSWPETEWISVGDGTLFSWSRMQVTHQGDSLTGTLTECGKDAPAVESPFFIESSYKLDYTGALFASTYLPSADITVTLNSSSPGATFMLSPSALIMGISMADPINDPWPDSASGLTQEDIDEDGRPGVTAHYVDSGSFEYPRTDESFFADRADSAYVASRIVFSLSGTLTTCTQSSGSATVTHADTRIFGCKIEGISQDCDGSQANFLDNNTRSFQAGAATYTLVKVADSATCADILGALP